MTLTGNRKNEVQGDLYIQYLKLILKVKLALKGTAVSV